MDCTIDIHLSLLIRTQIRNFFVLIKRLCLFEGRPGQKNFFCPYKATFVQNGQKCFKMTKNASKWLKMLQSAPKNTLKNAKIDKRAGITPRKRPIHIAFPPRDLT